MFLVALLKIQRGAGPAGIITGHRAGLDAVLQLYAGYLVAMAAVLEC